MATFIKNNCACCPPNPCDGCDTPQACNLFPASAFQKYLDHAENLPPQIYFGGTRQFNDSQYVSAVAGGPPLDVKTWGGVTGGTLVSRSGLGYGNTTNGVILEPIDPDFPSNGYTWAVYKDGQRSVADYLIDGITRHDNFASTYAVNLQNGFYGTGPNLLPANRTITRVSCGGWEELRYVPTIDSNCQFNPAWLVFPPDSDFVQILKKNRDFSINTNGFGLPDDVDDGPSALGRSASAMTYALIQRDGYGVCLPYFPGSYVKPAPTNYVGNGIAGEWGALVYGESYYNAEGDYYEWLPYDQPIFKNAYLIE